MIAIDIRISSGVSVPSIVSRSVPCIGSPEGLGWRGRSAQSDLGSAHCTAPTKMDGFDAPDSEFVLRSHHESDWGVAPQVLLREGQGVTMMKFLNPGELMACTGTLLGNIQTQPDDGVGGCRTAFEMAVDDVNDTRDIRGHHNVLIYGKHMPMLKAYCQLAGLAISHITGKSV